MANEATQVEGPYEVHDFTQSGAGLAIEQGAFMILSGSALRSTKISSASGEAFAGIAATEKTAADSNTQIGLWTTGIFDMTAAAGLAASINNGALVSLSGVNLIKSATAGEILSGAVVGRALESIASSATGEVKLGFSP